MKDFSIIIPCYNVTATIRRCLDSVYSQGLKKEDFEVICIDDCSTDPASAVAIENYTFRGIHPDNLTLLRHAVNKRQGAARNTGLGAATGDFILFLDADDYYLEGTLRKLQDAKRANPDLDFIMFDIVRNENANTVASPYSRTNSTETMSGQEFYLTQRYEKASMTYMYNRKSMEKASYRFPENVLFEDGVITLDYILKARRCMFLPITAYCYTMEPDVDHTMFIGNNKTKIVDYFRQSTRYYQLYEKNKNGNTKVADKLLRETIYQRRNQLRYIWRLPLKSLLTTLNEERLTGMTGDRLVDTMSKHPRAVATALFCVKPLLRVAEFFYSLRK